MAKGYWIGRVDVTDPEQYKNYLATNGPAFEKYGAKFLVRGGDFSSLEGENRSRNVVIEFESVETALACYNSPEYQTAKAHRLPASEADIFIIEGYE
ncbi:DUF1330 domain-containing protein [Kiloniella sp. b19]|uniref:DUF1330 domain-containing protein n=1 Tax=Kiloniella sp. GXU_MW_B19 TaxID=3141326 RepID=UPI0031D7C890